MLQDRKGCKNGCHTSVSSNRHLGSKDNHQLKTLVKLQHHISPDLTYPPGNRTTVIQGETSLKANCLDPIINETLDPMRARMYSSSSHSHPSPRDFHAALGSFQQDSIKDHAPQFRVLYTFPAVSYSASSSSPSCLEPDESGSTAPAATAQKAEPIPRHLYVLDSSFNPPTKAHFHMALSALRHDAPRDGLDVKRLLLLLAVRNADKGASSS